jgi:hypothetical protein
MMIMGQGYVGRRLVMLADEAVNQVSSINWGACRVKIQRTLWCSSTITTKSTARYRGARNRSQNIPHA